MYFDTTFFDEEYKPKSIQLICDKCGEYIEVNYDNEYISRAQSEYCIVTNCSMIICKCGNQCQNGLIEPKKESKIIYTQQLRQQINTISNRPKCPTCQSTNLKKISTTSKLVDIAVWGVFGSKRHKTFHCNHCGYEW